MVKPRIEETRKFIDIVAKAMSIRSVDTSMKREKERIITEVWKVQNN